MKISTFLLSISLFSGTVATAQGTLSNGLLAYYPFSGNVQDVSGNNRHLTNMGASLTMDAGNRPNNAYYFDGSSSYMMLPANAGVNFTGDFTICMKMQPLGYFRGLCHGNALISKSGDLYDSYGVGMEFSDNLYTNGNNCNTPVVDTVHQTFYIHKYHQGSAYSTGNLSTAPYVTYAKWRSLVMMQKGDTLYQYVDDILITKTYAIPYTGYNNYYISIGKLGNNYNTYHFNGVMDELRFYNRALTPAEVVAYGSYTPPALAVTAAGTQPMITVTPNPATDLLTLTNPTVQGVGYRILNMQGSLVASGTAPTGAQQLPVSQLAKGMYLLEVQQGQAVETHRFVKD